MTTAGPPGSGPGELKEGFGFAWRGLSTQWRVLSAVFLNESGVRRNRALPMGWLIASLEPLIIIGAISTLFVLLNRAPAYGDNTLLLVGTGVFPMYMVIYTSMRVREPVASSSINRYPIETALDEAIAHSLLHVIATAIVAIAFFYTLSRLGVRDAIPFDPGTAIAALAAMLSFGIGLGMINSVVGRFFPFWASLWPGVIRAMVHFSGIYIVADYLPPDVRRYFDVNPLLNGINWFRHAFYVSYPEATDHRFRVMLIALITLALGLAMERGLRRGVLRGDFHP